MIQELETVVLTHDVTEHGLKRGDLGAVVHWYADRGGFEVEFVTAEGKTVAVLTLTEADILWAADKFFRPGSSARHSPIAWVRRSAWRYRAEGSA
ncbi:MAG: DUF4926 domain-containing protein [candidate division NC10 bacterium]|nr:DUF4926 domain-containing protein [candidate division NC10 bacterium]MBI2116033.1 DUF4926 domain-containing protein [candidate division NC10 bacterium]MBI2456103.1 DUF4926 domain-containing protein [candidate division NC10 bacterium]